MRSLSAPLTSLPISLIPAVLICQTSNLWYFSILPLSNMEALPLYVSIVFIATTFLTVGFFFKAARSSIKTLLALFSWLAVQGFIGYAMFYTVTDTLPPRFLLAVFPPLLTIVILFSTTSGRSYIDALHMKWLTLLHVVRIPVEVVLFWLCAYQLVPELMTFEGRNFDIVSGITAPIIFYFGCIKQQLPKAVMIGWNILCLALLINIVTHAVLSAPSPFQQLAFEQPNVGVLYFPFIWLPSCIVPLVLFSHLAALRQLIKNIHL